MICILPALRIPTSGDRTRDIEEATAHHNSVLEKLIRARPEEWMWGHRRFRHSPDLPAEPYGPRQRRRRGSAPTSLNGAAGLSEGSTSPCLRHPARSSQLCGRATGGGPAPPCATRTERFQPSNQRPEEAGSTAASDSAPRGFAAGRVSSHSTAHTPARAAPREVCAGSAGGSDPPAPAPAARTRRSQRARAAASATSSPDRAPPGPSPRR